MKHTSALRSGLALLLPLWLAACASPSPTHEVASENVAKQMAKVGKAVEMPLADLNLVRAEIPPVLQAAQKGPYRPPLERTCPALASEVQALDAVLGADLDTPVTSANPSLIERGADAMGDAAAGAVRNVTGSIIPYRNWVRKLTGSEHYAKDVAAAIAAGSVRRSYLKGLGQGLGCPAPAAPAAPN